MKFDYANPYTSTRIPVFARNVVSTSHPLAAQAGLRILQQGGNAVDAAVATAAVMTLVEPVSNGLGSDAFCILWDGERLHGLNASGCPPPGRPSTSIANTARTPRHRHSAASTPSSCPVPSAAGSRCPSTSASCPSRT
jgi:gamma-glutamyltranspeptidase/glutathione hydrolase